MNNEGVILTVEALIDSPMTDELELISGLHSALQSECGLHSPNTEPSELEVTVKELRLALKDEKRKSETQQEELSEIKEALVREKQKVKRIWREKCNQLLAHEDQQDTKDIKIRDLKAQLARLQSSCERCLEELKTPANQSTVSPSTDKVTSSRRLEYGIFGRTQSNRVGKTPFNRYLYWGEL